MGAFIQVNPGSALSCEQCFLLDLLSGALEMSDEGFWGEKLLWYLASNLPWCYASCVGYREGRVHIPALSG